jgi:Importin-beta N-terminal domain
LLTFDSELSDGRPRAVSGPRPSAMEVEGIAELPGDANPLSDRLVLQILQNSLSGQRESLISAKQQLEEWQTKPRYHAALQRIAGDKANIAHPIRLAAIIQLKNGVDKYWRRGAANVVSDDEKAQIRENLLRVAVNEDDRQLAKMMGVVAAKIARFDFPLKWYILV